jgi:hypothetical protein
MFETIKSAAQTVADTFQGVVSAGVERMKTSFEEFSAACPDLEKIGYHVSMLELCCALNPNFTVFLDRRAAPTEEAFQAVLAAHPNNATFRTVVGLLRQAEKVIAKFERPQRRCTCVAVELGVPPRVRLMYAPSAVGVALEAECSAILDEDDISPVA